MKSRLLPGLLSCALFAAPFAFGAEPKEKSTSSDMQRAIAFERYKDLAAARQARKERIHPSVPAPGEANRSADRSTEEAQPGNVVKDPGPSPSTTPSSTRP